MLYSSGTTGRPKGVKRVLSGEPLGATPGAAALAQGVFGMTDEFVYLSVAPLYHAAPFGFRFGGHGPGRHRCDRRPLRSRADTQRYRTPPCHPRAVRADDGHSTPRPARKGTAQLRLIEPAVRHSCRRTLSDRGERAKLEWGARSCTSTSQGPRRGLHSLHPERLALSSTLYRPRHPRPAGKRLKGLLRDEYWRNRSSRLV